jgi:16S rRNA (cytidine1402-2'-O)-methyltransferase
VGTLYLVATPIGNLADVSLRALEVLASVSLVAAEDTRHARKLFDRHEIATPLLSYHEHNKASRLPRLLQALDQGDLALISDAGTPGLQDPGYELVRAALQAGHRVSPIPGPSAPVTALTASGLPADRYSFLGYLPRQEKERRDLLASLADRSETLVFFEAPHRLREALQDLAAAFGVERAMVIGREMTKMHEEFVRGSLGEIVRHFAATEPRGEFTLVIAGRESARPWDEDQVRRELKECLASGLSPSAAARQVAQRCGWPRQAVYRLTLEEK